MAIAITAMLVISGSSSFAGSSEGSFPNPNIKASTKNVKTVTPVTDLKIGDKKVPATKKATELQPQSIKDSSLKNTIEYKKKDGSKLLLDTDRVILHNQLQIHKALKSILNDGEVDPQDEDGSGGGTPPIIIEGDPDGDPCKACPECCVDSDGDGTNDLDEDVEDEPAKPDPKAPKPPVA